MEITKENLKRKLMEWNVEESKADDFISELEGEGTEMEESFFRTMEDRGISLGKNKDAD